MTPLRIFFGSLAIFFAGFEAQAQFHNPNRPPIFNPRPGHPGHPGFPGHPGHGGGPVLPPSYNPPQYGTQKREIFVNRYMQNERMDLNLFLERNIAVDSVEVWTNNQYNSYSNLNLLVDGMLEDSRSVYSGVTMLFPRRPVEMGFNISRLLSLEVRGVVFVDRIVVNFRRFVNPGPNPGGFDLSMNVNQFFQGFNSLDLGQLVNLQQYRGFRVSSVMIQGSSLRGHGQINVLANGFSQGGAQILPVYSTAATFFMTNQSTIGFDLNSLVLQMQGNITIERVVIRVVR